MGWDPFHCWIVLSSSPAHPDLFSFPKSFLSLQHCQDTTGGTARTLQGRRSWGSWEFPSFLIVDLGFSAAEAEHFLKCHVKTSRKRDLSINPCSNSSGHWRQPQIPFWNTGSKIPQNKRVLSSETCRKYLVLTNFWKINFAAGILLGNGCCGWAFSQGSGSSPSLDHYVLGGTLNTLKISQ